MEINSDNVEIIEEVDSCEGITDLELEIEVKTNIKTEVFDETNNADPHQIIGKKRKNNERSNLEIENKKIKDEFVLLEETDYKKEPQEIEELYLDDLNNQVINLLKLFIGYVVGFRDRI